MKKCFLICFLFLASCYGKRINEDKVINETAIKDKEIEEIIKQNQERICTVDSINAVTTETIDDVIDSFDILKKRIKTLRKQEKVIHDTVYVGIEDIIIEDSSMKH